MKNLLRNSRLTELDFYNEFVDDNCQLDNTPKHLPFRFNLDKNNNIQDSWEDGWDSDHQHDNYWQQCKRIDALLDKSIGKPFDEIYSKVCHEYPKMIRWGMTLKDYFNNQFKPNCYWGRGKSGPYYVDENGLIQENKPEPRRKKKYTIIRDINKEPEYRVNHNEIQNQITLMNTIYYTMGKDAYYRLLDSETISERFYNDLKQATHYDYALDKIIDKMVWRYVYDKNLHKTEYKRIKAEDKDFQKKRERENKKLREEQRDGLVQYLTWIRKNKDRENDVQNRDRHGFDNKSFKKEKEE